MIEIGLGGLVLATATFVAGRLFVQSENIILKKKEVYQAYLDTCITAHDAYDQQAEVRIDRDQLTPKGDFYLYASQEVIILAGLHIQSLEEVFECIDDQSEPLHPAFQQSIQKYNAVLRAMRRDVLGWSFHGLYEKFFGDKRAKKILEDQRD